MSRRWPTDRYRLTADRDVRPDAARAVVAANGSLRRLSVDEPSLEAIYARYFQTNRSTRGSASCGVKVLPFQGLGTVLVKELSDNISSARMLVLELLIVLTALAALYGAIDSLRQTTAEDPFLLLRLFTVDRAPLPSFVAILGFLDSADGDRARLRRDQRRAQPAHAVAHPGAADLSRRAADGEIPRRAGDARRSAWRRCGCWWSASG